MLSTAGPTAIWMGMAPRFRCIREAAWIPETGWEHPRVMASPGGKPARAPPNRTRKPGARPRVWRRLLRALGPGFVTGASDDDPSGIGTYAAAGAALGYSTLWLALVTFPLQAAVQFVCAKIGLLTGRGLAGVLRRHTPRPVAYAAVFALFVANTLNAGADIGATA